MTDPQRAAADYIAALTDDEMAAFVASARAPQRQLTEQEVQMLYRERRYDEIVAALADGRLNTLTGVPQGQTDLVDRAQRLAPVTRADLAELNRLGRHDLAAAYGQHLDCITD